MKLFYYLLCVSCLTISCKEAIKNDVKFIADKGFEDIQFVEPTINPNSIVTAEEDLFGYWVGDFDANLSDEEMDSIYGNEKYANLITRKITFSIDEIKGDSIIGHSIVAGNISPFKGLIIENDSFFSFEVDEFKKTKTDGKFSVTITKNDSIMKGNWNAYNSTALKIYSRKFELKKKFFEYNPKNNLEATFLNTDKSKNIKITDTIDNEIEVYEDTEYFATTQKIFEKNASDEELKADFVSNLSKADISILRNSIFARHGFAFRDKQLRMYFEQYNWYMPVFGDVKKELTDIEKKNIDLLLRYEKNAEEYYDTFGR